MQMQIYENGPFFNFSPFFGECPRRMRKLAKMK
jgi:hypothetical protein